MKELLVTMIMKASPSMLLDFLLCDHSSRLASDDDQTAYDEERGYAQIKSL